MLTSFELQKIAFRSQSLQERLTRFSQIKHSTGKLQDETLNRVYRWRELTSYGDQKCFEKRLSNAGINFDQLDALFCNDDYLGIETPKWIELFKETLEAVENCATESETTNDLEHHKFLSVERPVPFEELFCPIIKLARGKINSGRKGKSSLLLDSADTDLDRFLLTRLSETCGRVLELELNTFLAILQIDGLDYRAIRTNSQSREHYQRFIDRLFDGDFERICREYPVFARHLTHRVAQWIDIAVEFDRRLSNDIDELKRKFEIPNCSRPVHLKPGLSDAHDNGRAVILVEFETAQKLIYKPKTLGPDVAYFELARWLNKKGSPYSFRLLQIIEKERYGWMEFAENDAISEHEGASRFYLRAGSLLALFYALGGVDFHHENVIACGEYPIPIDCETIVQHRTGLSGDKKLTISAARKSLSQSVLKAHFLPQLHKIRGAYVDVSGMGTGGEDKRTAIEILKHSHINTDAMVHRVETVKKSFDSANAPRVGDKTLVPEDYTDDVVQGFSDMYRFILSIQDQLLDEGSPFIGLFRQPVRYFHRATQLYGSLLARISHPKFQRDGLDLGIELEVLYRDFLSAPDDILLRPLVDIEVEDLFRLDLPKFMANADEDSIALVDGSVLDARFDGSPLENAMKKIREFCESDLLWQTKLIRSSMIVRRGVEVTNRAARTEQPMQDSSLLNQEELIDIAQKIADEIRSRAMITSSGDPSWVTVISTDSETQFYPRDVGFDLYQGNVGIGVFFAAMEKVNSGKGYKDFVYSSINLVRRWIKIAKPMDVATLGIGGMSGVGSLIYGLTSISSLLGDNELLKDAIHANELVTERMISEDNVLHVHGGSAGMVCALLALFRATRDQDFLRKASICGDHLLAKRQKIGTDLIGWKMGSDGLAPTGFSRGTAGITYALLSLYRETGKRSFYGAAEEAIAYEEIKNDTPEATWVANTAHLKERFSEATGPVQGWCNGPAGVALSRIATLDVFDTKAVRTQIETFLNMTANAPYLDDDHLCCGSISAGEVLLSAAARYQSPAWNKMARRLVSETVSRRTKNHKFKPESRFNELYNPTLFQGSSGFGYHCLRLVDSADLPDVLLLE
jgi:type 2 lantibiotic biosynthesis protein LanM